MLWRLAPKEFEAGKGAGNRNAMKALIEGGAVPGLLAYLDGEVAGWCAVAPRADYPSLARSRILQPVDDKPCWSVSCLFVDRRFRRKGISAAFLRAAVDYVASQGGAILEAYPVEPRNEKPVPAAFAWTGIASAYVTAGFEEVARRSSTRPIMRITCSGAPRRCPGV